MRDIRGHDWEARGKLVAFIIRALPAAIVCAYFLVVAHSIPAWGADEHSYAESASSGATAGLRAPAEMPDHGASTGAQARFSNPPTDQEILVCGILPQPMAPVGKTKGPENRALIRALLDYEQSTRMGGAPDALQPLTRFLQHYPASAWTAALSLNLGIIYRRTGHMGKALSAWRQAWDLSKSAQEPKARAIADYAVGQLAEFEAYLGRVETLEPLLNEVKGRPLHGTGAENISNASQGLAEMRTHPEDAFRCGPMALYRICLLQRRTAGAARLEAVPSTSRGTSLTQVLGWAHEVGLDYQMAFRQPGAPLLAPAVMHWKVGHFAALMKQANGGYRIEDPTFGETIAVRQVTLDAEGSGYFVVPAGPLPPGWRTVSSAEGSQIWGRGYTSSQDKDGTAQLDVTALPDPCRGRFARAAAWIAGAVRGLVGGMATANVQAMVVGLTIRDVPLNYQPAKGPGGTFELYYSHRDALQPAIFTYTNFGPKWTSNWISYLTDNTSTTGTVDLYLPGGGGESYNSNGTTFGPGVDDQALVTKIIGGFVRSLPDGSMQTFKHQFATSPPQFLLTSVSDPQGNTVSLAYDTHSRISSITDAAGAATTLTYGLATDIYKVTRVTDPFGRFAVFTYNGDGTLASITDSLGITSRFTYLFGSGDFIYVLTTPYGTDTFTYGDSTTDYKLGTTRFVTLTDPLGQTQRVEFRQGAPGIPNSDPPNTVPTGMSVENQYLYYRNTFAWDAHQLALATNPDGTVDYTKATIFHFLHGNPAIQTSRTLESIKRPLENRIWFDYPAQASPINQGSTNQAMHIGRVLDDGTTQLVTIQRNNQGRLTQYTDPASRQITLKYAPNGIDLVSMAQTTSGANQMLFSTTYNSQHRPLSITDASGQTTTFTYNSAGQVTSATDALHETTTYTYSTSGLLQTVTRPLTGAVTTLAYDSADRIATMTDSIGYKYSFAYDNGDRLTKVSYPDGTSDQFVYNLLDLATVTDRLGRTTQYTYDPLRRMTQSKDPLGRTTALAYCDCGAVSKITDPKGIATNFVYDLEDREIAKIYSDGSQTLSVYEQTTSRLKTVTDALGQITTYGYNKDDTLKNIAYSKAVNPTPAVSLAWDPSFRRMTRMTDGTGTTTYTYNPITGAAAPGQGRLKTISGPYGSVSYTYDALGRALTTNISGAVSTLAFDTIGRVISDNNPIDKFTISYLGATIWPVSIQSANGLNTLYTYFNNAGDDRLQTIMGKTHGGATLASLRYAYDAEGEVTSTIVNGQFAGTVTRTMTYDAGGQLLTLTASGEGNNFAFTYDPASNRTSQKVASTTTNFTYNKLNQLITPAPATYDADGQPLNLQGTSFAWDAANRLISVSAGTKTTKFAYDGLGRRTRITQISGTTTVSDRNYFWCGTSVCVETDASSHAITKRYLPEGVVQGGQSLYYLPDNLGGVRELINATGVVEASYDYDPFGARRRISGTMNSDFGFSGLFHESQSGLDLAAFRAYSASLGRWLNRDPIGETGGINLYSYVSNTPLSLSDPLGLYAEVKVEDNNVTITLPIEYSGPGAHPDVIKTFNDGIESRWSGRFGKYNVKTVVVTPSKETPCAKKNRINVPSHPGRSFVQGDETGSNRGVWHPHNPPEWRSTDVDWVAAHESGHLMGLPDRYTDEGGAMKGYESDIMAAHGGTPSEEDIAAIIAANP